MGREPDFYSHYLIPKSYLLQQNKIDLNYELVRNWIVYVGRRSYSLILNLITLKYLLYVPWDENTANPSYFPGIEVTKMKEVTFD